MRKRWRSLIAGLLILLGGPTTGLAQHATQWINPPFASSTPHRAEREGVPFGLATVSCSVRSNGRLFDCEVVEELPAGYEFGRHALRSARDARLNPSLVGDLERISFTITFCLVDDCEAARDRLTASAAPHSSGPAAVAVADEPDPHIALAWARQREPLWPRDDVSRAEADYGVVSLICRLHASGALSNCIVESEQPRRSGFGREAVLAAHLSRLQPHIVDGVAVEGRVRIVTVFCNVVCFTYTPSATLIE